MNFHNYLKRSKHALSTLQKYDTVHVVLGNESCDLDSAASALIYGFLLHTLNVKDTDSKFVAIPVLNCDENDLPLKTEMCFLLRKLGVNLRDLIFRNQIDLKKLQDEANLKVTLVDHHVLAKGDKDIEKSVVEIYDHRPLNEVAAWDKDKVKIDIQQVGSCCSIIASEVLKNDSNILNSGISTLLYETIIFDTIGLKPEAKKAKELDIEMIQKLQNKYNLSDNYEKIFENLWTVHNDVSHLTPLQILTKDLKIVEGIPVPALPMLAGNFLKLDGVEEDIGKFCELYNSKVAVVLGIEVIDDKVQRDVAIYKTEPIDLADKIIKKLQAGIDGNDFQLTQTSCDLNSVTYFTQGNVALSRKQIIPVVLSAMK